MSEPTEQTIGLSADTQKIAGVLRDIGIVDAAMPIAARTSAFLETCNQTLGIKLAPFFTGGGIGGAAAGGTGITEIGKHNQELATLITTIDDPAIAAVLATILMVKKIKEVRTTKQSASDWLKGKILEKVSEIQANSTGDNAKMIAKPAATITAIMTLAYIALNNEQLAGPINGIMGGFMGALLGAHTESMVNNEESVSEALARFATGQLPKLREYEPIYNKINTRYYIPTTILNTNEFHGRPVSPPIRPPNPQLPRPPKRGPGIHVRR